MGATERLAGSLLGWERLAGSLLGWATEHHHRSQLAQGMREDVRDDERRDSFVLK